MTIYNSYTDPKNFKNKPDINKEIIPKNAIFAIYPHEKILFNTDGVIKYPQNLNAMVQYPLSELAVHVLGIIASYDVVTTKMISEVLGMLSFENDTDKVFRAIERLRKLDLIYSFRFISEDSKSSNYIVHSLTKPAGENVAYNIGVYETQVAKYNITEPIHHIKFKLARNQIIFAYLKRNTLVAEFDNHKKITTAESSLRPSLFITFNDNSSIIYEIPRKDCDGFWKGKLENKLAGYKIIFENGWNFKNEIPNIVVCCESESHSVEVKEIADKIGINVLFTHDLLMFGDNFEKHIYSLDENNKPEFYKIQFEQ